ncbi:MAG: Wzz/FepE/Etk N-terminal domain-containing protein [Gammaproteobacteria bacterium]|nr:Wzz/FepE/Etk N-terminal domain-containing protein [Gammaproteobacteria bacterium]
MKDAVNKVHEISTPNPPSFPAQQWYEEDSINLVDLWLELAKHRAIIFGAIILALAAGLLVAFLLPQKYTYSTSIEIGSTLETSGSGEVVRLIDQPESVLAKIKESYIPLVQQEFHAAHPTDDSLYKIEARAPKNSLLIVLEAKGKADNRAIYLEHLQSVTDKLLEDHQRVMNIYRGRLHSQLALAQIELDEIADPSTLATKQKDLETQLNTARIKQAELSDPRMLTVPRQELENILAKEQKRFIDLQDQAVLIKARYQRQDDTDALLKQQISDLEAQIKSAFAQRQQAIGNMQNEAAAMTMLLIDNEIQQNRTRLATLQERLHIGQQNLRQELEEQIASNLREQGVQDKIIAKTRSELSRLAIGNQRAQQRQAPEIANLEEQLKKLTADNRRAIERQQQAISTLETQLQNIQPTRAITPPIQSLQPTGPGKSIIIILALIVGGLLGIFAAFFASFLNKVRLQTTQA